MQIHFSANIVGSHDQFCSIDEINVYFAEICTSQERNFFRNTIRYISSLLMTVLENLIKSPIRIVSTTMILYLDMKTYLSTDVSCETQNQFD